MAVVVAVLVKGVLVLFLAVIGVFFNCTMAFVVVVVVRR
jgi:hypothetical protein